MESPIMRIPEHRPRRASRSQDAPEDEDANHRHAVTVVERMQKRCLRAGCLREPRLPPLTNLLNVHLNLNVTYNWTFANSG